MEMVLTKMNLFRKTTVEEKNYVVVHPIFDVPEEKVDTDTLGPMKMTTTVRFSLIALRSYLIIMILLTVYRSLVITNIIR